MIQDKKIHDRIVELEKAYRGDNDALDEIARAKETIEYHESKGDNAKAVSALNNLTAFLHDWY